MKNTQVPYASSLFRRILPAAMALASGVAGGALFCLLHLPMPWLLGALCGTALSAMTGKKVAVPGWLRSGVLVVVGLMIGSGIHQDSLAEIARWPLTMAGVSVYVAVVIATIYRFLRRFARFDPVTAYFAASPGGILMMTTLGGSFGGRERDIALIHAVRVVLVLFTIVVGYDLMLGSGTTGTSAAAASHPTWLQAGIWVTLGAAGWLLGQLLRLPSASMLGPFLLIAVVQLLGFSVPHLPDFPLLVAEVVLGSGIGSDFVGVTPKELLRGMIISFFVSLWMLVLSLLFSLALAPFAGMSPASLFLAFSPGGLSAISLVALALNIDPAFVTTHNVLRVLLILFASPLVFRFMKKRNNPHPEVLESGGIENPES